MMMILDGMILRCVATMHKLEGFGNAILMMSLPVVIQAWAMIR